MLTALWLRGLEINGHHLGRFVLRLGLSALSEK